MPELTDVKEHGPTAYYLIHSWPNLILAIAKLENAMRRNLRYVFWVYVAGALVTAAMFIQGIYENGGFQRHHSVADFLMAAAINLAAAMLWPVLVVVVILQYFGALPAPIEF